MKTKSAPKPWGYCIMRDDPVAPLLFATTLGGDDYEVWQGPSMWTADPELALTRRSKEAIERLAAEVLCFPLMRGNGWDVVPLYEVQP